MDRRSVIAGVSVVAALTPTVVEAAQNHVNWTVPKDIYKVRVQRWNNNSKDLDVYLDVNPGDVFTLDVVKQ